MYSFCVPDCRKAHSSFYNTLHGVCEWGGEYCRYGEARYGCQSNPTNSGWSTITSSYKWDFPYPGAPSSTNYWNNHYFAGATFRESKYNDACTPTTTTAGCPSCQWGQSKDPGTNTCSTCFPDPYYPGGIFCSLASGGAWTGWLRCNDGYVDSTGKCVSSCPKGTYGAVDTGVTANGGITISKCIPCDTNCKECVGPTAGECISCLRGKYLARAVPATLTVTYGSCLAKSGTSTTLTVYVKSSFSYASNGLPTATAATVQGMGTSAQPFINLYDAIAKAYELGAPKVSATVTILLMATSDGHSLRPQREIEYPYVPVNTDDQQTTQIVITSDGNFRSKIYYKLRDKFTFKVGAGLTIQNVRFEALDSTAYQDRDHNDVWGSMVWASAANSCQISGTSIGKCGNPQTQAQVYRPPRDNCLFPDGLGAGLFTFDISDTTGLTAPPTLLISNVEFYQFAYNFNSLVELNDYGGIVVIEDSVFEQFSTCGAIIRNKRVILDRSIPATPPVTYQDHYLARSNRMLTEQYQEKYATMAISLTCPASGCFSITIDNSTFKDFGPLKAPLSQGVAVNPASKMLYVGQVVDLDGFKGPVKITGNTFYNIGLKYSTCNIAKDMLNIDPSTLPDSFPIYGAKTKYQIKSLISIVNQDKPVHILNNNFDSNQGTKGIIYLDLNHNAAQERAIIGGNTFKKNVGYVDASVIFIRARGPGGKNVYDALGSNAEAYCGGYLLQQNLFENNFGCIFYTGGLIKIECVNEIEISDPTSYIDQITTPASATFVDTSYSTLTPSTYAPLLGSTVTYSTFSYQADIMSTTFKQNTFQKNFGTGSKGLVHLSGMSRLIFNSETFTDNGDIQKEISDKLRPAFSTYQYLDPKQVTPNDFVRLAYTNAPNYPQNQLMKSLIHIERTTQVNMQTMTFSTNWLIENACNDYRAQLITFADIGGQVIMKGITITDQKGISQNNYIKGTGPNLNLGVSPAGTYTALGSETPLFRFFPSVKLKQLLMDNWQMSGIWYVQNNACSLTATSLIMAFPADGVTMPQAQVDSFVFESTVQSLIKDIECRYCTKPVFEFGSMTLTESIKNVRFQAINQHASSVVPYVQYGPLMKIQIKKPLNLIDGSGNPYVFTPTLTMDNLQVETFTGFSSGTDTGRLFELNYITDLNEILLPPTMDQVFIKNSLFKTINAQGNGVFAQADLGEIRVNIDTTSFTSITSTTIPSYGVFNGVSMGSLVLNAVTATGLKNQVTDALPLGGGRFFYLNQPSKPFNLEIKGTSVFTCSSTAFVAGSTEQNDIATLKYTQGSLFQLIGDTEPFTVNVKNSKFINCYTAKEGGALSLKSISSKVTLGLDSNQFQGNMAVYGGSIFCENCEILTGSLFKWQRNSFTTDYANQGGNIYIHNIVNVMDPTSYFMLDGHSHISSAAKVQGGGIFYKEDNQQVRIEIVKNSPSTVSEFKTLSAQTLDGGAIFINQVTATPQAIDIKVSTTTFLSNQASSQSLSGGQGGGISIMSATDTVDLTFISCTINSNKALGGSGGFLYIESTSTNSNVQVQTSTINQNEAKQDGGSFYIGGTGDKILKLIESIAIESSKATLGSGGIAYITGLSSYAEISYASPPTAAQIKDALAGANGGLVYTVVDPASTTGCELKILNTQIETTTATNGAGGAYHCNGGGPALITIDASIIKTSTSYLDGGLVNLDVTGDIQFLVNPGTTITGTTSQTGAGGIARLKTPTNVLVDLKGLTDISYSKSKLQGGCFSLEGFLANTLNFRDQVKISQAETTDDEGGVAYFSGTDNVLLMTAQTEIQSCTAAKGGGCYKLGGTATNNVIILGDANYSPKIASAKADSTNPAHAMFKKSGGFIYLGGLIQNVLIKNIILQASAAGGTGGFIYSEVPVGANPKVTITIDSDTVGQSFTPLSAGLRGSLMFISGFNAPLATILLRNTIFKCKSLDFCIDQTRFGAVYDNLALPSPVLIGGLFYFEDGVIGTVTSNSNYFKHCYSTREGAVWYLRQGLKLIDSGSQYYGNAGLKGIIYCYQCQVVQTGADYTCSIAQQAAFLYIDSGPASSGYTGTLVSVQYSLIQHGRSLENGGGIYAAGENTASLKLNNCGVIQFFETAKDGGFFYIASPYITLEKIETNWNHLKAVGNGGLIEGLTSPLITVDPTFAVPCRLGNISQPIGVNEPTFDSGQPVGMKGCDITCGRGAVTIPEQQSELAKTAGKFSIYKMTNVVVQSADNKISNCTAMDGAIFKFDRSDFEDTNSVFEYNGADRGGVAFCNACRMKFIGSVFNGNYAQKGGIFYIENYGELILEDVTIISSRAFEAGGIVYAEGNEADMNPKTTGNYVGAAPTVNYIKYIKISISQTAPLEPFGDFESQQNGAGIYIKNGVLNVNDMEIDLISAQKDGGFIYSDGLVEITMTNTKFTNLQADRGGFIYSNGAALPAPTIPSYLKFIGTTTFDSMLAKSGGGGFYINYPHMELYMNTPITVTNAKTTLGHGGVFYLENIKKIDFNQLVTGDFGVYTDLAVPDPSYGSFLYSVAVNSQIQLQDLKIKCQTLPPTTSSQADFLDFLENTNVKPNYGGAIFVQDALLVTSTKNFYQYCYQTNEGGIFHLTTSVNAASQATYTAFEEYGSLYEYNQAEKGGVFYCDKCTMKFDPVDGPINIRFNWAREGGAIFIQDIFNGLIKSVTFRNNQASFKGGVFAFVNTMPSPPKSQLTILNSQILNSEAKNKLGGGIGGVFYIETRQINRISISNTMIDQAKSLGSGGVFYVQLMKQGEILIDTGTKIRNFGVDNTQKGSMFYSALEKEVLLTIKNTQINCNMTALWSDALDAINAVKSYQAGAIYMEGSDLGVVSFTNTFSQCSSSEDGAIFYIVNSVLKEDFSTFTQIAALYGPIMKCRNCQFTISDSNMDGSQAESGGAFMVENNAAGMVRRTTFRGCKAHNQGGLLSVVQSGLAQLDDSVIQFIDCFHMNGNIANQGGVFYMNQPKITIHLINSIISNSLATDTASVVFIQSGGGFIIERSQVKDIFAPKSTVLFSTSTQLKLQIIQSTLICNALYKSTAVIEEFSKIYVPSISTNSFFLSGNQNTQVITKSSTFQQCGMLEDGGLFRMEGKVNFTDIKSLFQDNSGTEGGVFSCSQCNITLVGSNLKKNQAKRGGVVKLEAQANFTSIDTVFSFNLASEIGGVIFVTTQSVFNLLRSKFYSNEANVSSTIDVLGASSYLINYIDGCIFQNNSAVKNTVSLNKARAMIANSKFQDNFSKERSKNIFVAFAEVNITACEFQSPEYPNIQRELAKDETMGAFIFIILDVQIIISGTKFINGLAKYGGAIYVSGQSDLTLDSCQILKNNAYLYGGAIFANGFRSIKLQNGTRLLDNLANLQGDDFYLSNTEDALEMQDVTIQNAMAKNSLYGEQITLKLNRVRYQNLQFNPLSEKGTAIQCYGCRKIDISNSIFKDIKSKVGGAIHITDMPTNKKPTDGRGKYKIQNTAFEGVTANLGGAMYLDHPQNLQIINSSFYQAKALNLTTDQTNSPSGIGGAIYFACSLADTNCDLEILGRTSFTQCYASIKGGAIHYTYNEPHFGPNISFVLNKAGWYGDSISCYSQQLKPVSFIEYNRQVRRINYPMSNKQFQEYVYNSTRTSPPKRLLQNVTNDTTEEMPFDLFGTTDKSNFTAQEVRSGGVIPDFQIAHVDKYGQIVADFDSKIRVSIDQEYFTKDSNTKKYTPVLEGTTQYTSFGGVSQVQNLQFSGAPGYKYRVAFLSSGIDEKLPENQKFKEIFSESSIEFDFYVELRDCALGEYFTQVGKCIYCESSMGFALAVQKEPGECKPCPWDKANCKGGANIGPKPGYWRKSNTSENFIRCPNPDVCLGWVAPDWDPKGACTEGQTGVLCAECLPGFSLTGLAKCGRCPDLTSNVVKLGGMVIGIAILFVFMVKSTIAGATQQKNNTSIYMKILMNHFQLILLVSSFNFQWPEQIQVFFSATSPVSEVSTQVVSVDCFMSAKASFASGKDSFFKTYFIKLVIFAILPLLLAIISYIFWGVQKCIRRTEFESGKAVATLVISLFTIHPNIVQTMFNDFNCKDVDGNLYVQTDMTIKCWDKTHSFWSYTVAAPSIVVWGLGIPFFALVLMFRERDHLDRVSTKEKFGFLYNGYTQALFFWEIVIMYRKIGMIFISVFIQPYGVISQALIVFLVMIVFLIANLKKKPYLAMSLNDLETISLLTSTLSIYCGIFFITDVPQKDVPDLPTSVKSSITLSESMKFLFFIIIMIANLAFFGYWFYKILQEVRNTLIKKLEKLYLYLFLCGDRPRLERIKTQMKIDEENELLREKYFNAVGNLKKMYKEGRLVLTQKTLERAQVYLNEDRYYEALGLGRREVNEKELKRFNRMAHGSELRQNERNQINEEFAKNMDRRRGGAFNPLNQLMIDEEYLEGFGKYQALNQRSTLVTQEENDFENASPAGKRGNRVVGIRPNSQFSGGYSGEFDQNDTQAIHLNSTNKFAIGGHRSLDSYVDEDGTSPQSHSKAFLNGANGPGALEIGLNQRMISSQNHFNSGHQGIMIHNQAAGQKTSQQNSAQGGGPISKKPKKGNQSSINISDDEDDDQKDQIWNQLEDEVHNMQKNEENNGKNEKQKEDALEQMKKEKYNQDLDIDQMVLHGQIQFQAQKNNVEGLTGNKKNGKYRSKNDVKRLDRGGTKKKQNQVPLSTPQEEAQPANNNLTSKPKDKKQFADSDQERIELELNGFNNVISDVEDAKSIKPAMRKKKQQDSSEEDNESIFSDHNKNDFNYQVTKQ